MEKSMEFQSTRDENSIKYFSAQVIKQGLADDGGLFVPAKIPSLTKDEIHEFCSLSYPQIAARVLSKFLTDYTYDELLEDCQFVCFAGYLSRLRLFVSPRI